MIQLAMVDLSERQSSYKINENSSQLITRKILYRNYLVHYHHMINQILPKLQRWKMMITDIKQQRQGFQFPQVLNLLEKMEKDDKRHSLSQKQLNSIIKEIVELFQIERNRVLSKKYNEYQIIFQRNYKMFKQFNRLNQLNGSLNPQKLIGLDIFAYLLELNERFRRSQPRISRQLSLKTIVQITKIQQIGGIRTSLKQKWQENYTFLDKQIQNGIFGMLCEILFLAHLKRKLTYFQQKKYRLQCDALWVPFQAFVPEQKYIFRNSSQFKYKFCQLAGYTTIEKNIKRKNYLHKGQINRNLQTILDRSQYSNQALELRALMLQHRLTFRLLSQWVNNQQNGVSFFPRPQIIVKKLEKCQWSLLNDHRIETNFEIDGKKSKNDPLSVLTEQNFIGQSICAIALKRFRTYAIVLSIQNKLMKKIYKGTSLYIRRLNYSYDGYYFMQHHKKPQFMQETRLKKQNDSQLDKLPYVSMLQEENNIKQRQKKQFAQRKNQKKIRKKEDIFTVIVGSSERKIHFGFKYDKQLSQSQYIEHLVQFLKTNHEQSNNIFLSELDFERTHLFQSAIIHTFISKFSRFVKFEASPTKFFYHLLVHTYVDKCLNQTPFQTKAEFSQLLSKSLLKIIKLINLSVDRTQVKIVDQIQDQEESYDQFTHQICKKISPNEQEQGLMFDQFDFVCEQKETYQKIHSIIKKILSVPFTEHQSINWQGKQEFLRQIIPCQYYLASKDNNLNSSETQEKIIDHPVVENIQGVQSLLSDLWLSFLKIFMRQWPFLTDHQISQKTKDLASFIKQKNTNLNDIKRLLRNITKSLLIYQAYFNELCCSNTEKSRFISNKYKKQVGYLNTIYSNQIENIEKLFPNKLKLFFAKLLKNFGEFPVTLEKIHSFYEATANMRSGSEVWKVQQDQIDPIKVQK